MKRILLSAGGLAVALTLAACGQKADQAQAPAAETAANTAASPASDSMAGMNMAASEAPKMAKGMGTVTAVSADSVTIDHAPIPEAGWPAMTMAFKASPEIAKQVKAGDKVTFDLKLEGGGGEITTIQRQ